MALKREPNLTYTALLLFAPKEGKFPKTTLKLLDRITPMSILVYILYTSRKKKVESLP